MSSHQDRTVDELFEAIVELSDRERHEYLDQVGVPDEVQEDVLDLIRADEASPRDSRFYSAASEVNVARLLPAELAADCLIGQDLGPFRIQDVIGIGGFGTVYQAFRRDHFEQRVAIKVVRADRSLNREHRVRFEVERSVLARLEHPNIARLIDGGCTDDGRSYFVMEYIAGRPLAEYCDFESLSIADRINLFLRVCDATAYAHQQGIVHRDLKSENILVLEGGTPKLIDFGIAKIVNDWNLDGKNLTRTGDSLLTPSCASPEQVCGEPITTASDVYALGVVLYELITGCFPIEFESQYDIAHAILNRRPDLPSQVLKRRLVGVQDQQLEQILGDRGTTLTGIQRCLRGDLDQIIMMSLRKEPERRYRSAVEFHADIQNYLEDRPVRARGDSLAYRTSKAVKRNVASFSVICSLILTCLLLSGLFVIQRNRKQEKHVHAVIERMQRLSFDQYFDGFVELQGLLNDHPDHSRLSELLDVVAAPAFVRTPSENVKVWIRPAQQPLREWFFVGTTPLDEMLLPKANLQWRIQDKNGTEFMVLRRHYRKGNVDLSFPHDHNAPSGMVKLTLGDDRTAWLPISGESRQVDGQIFIDKFEVTNVQFQRFVDAGGYETAAHWPEFFKDGNQLSFTDAIKGFRDQTGEFGPGNWHHGRFPTGEAMYPVREISWYEAMAYAKFAGKRLPTVFHWSKAATFGRTHSIVLMSNIHNEPKSFWKSAKHTRQPGHVWPCEKSTGVGVFGTLDMAGNVREWCSNATRDGRRYALGGSYRDVTYMYSYPEASSPWERSPETGFRCMSFGGNVPESFHETLRPVELVTRDFDAIEPIWSEEAFRSIKDIFRVSGKPQYEIENNVANDARVKGFIDSNRAKRIVFDAAYDGPSQQITGILYLPDQDLYEPPYQTIIHFPGTYSLFGRYPPYVSFLLDSGRAVFQPDYWGTGARTRDEFKSAQPRKTPLFKDAITKIVMDFSRSIDVLEEIELVDKEKLGYHGISWGAALGPILLAIDDRCQAAVLMGGGLVQTETYPIMEQANYCPHVNCPILMINGRHDSGFPPAAQRAMFKLFPRESHEHNWKMLEGSHFPNPFDRARYTKQWFDQHLGFVQAKQ